MLIARRSQRFAGQRLFMPDSKQLGLSPEESKQRAVLKGETPLVFESPAIAPLPEVMIAEVDRLALETIALGETQSFYWYADEFEALAGVLVEANYLLAQGDLKNLRDF